MKVLAILLALALAPAATGQVNGLENYLEVGTEHPPVIMRGIKKKIGKDLVATFKVKLTDDGLRRLNEQAQIMVNENGMRYEFDFLDFYLASKNGRSEIDYYYILKEGRDKADVIELHVSTQEAVLTVTDRNFYAKK